MELLGVLVPEVTPFDRLILDFVSMFLVLWGLNEKSIEFWGDWLNKRGYLMSFMKVMERLDDPDWIMDELSLD